MLRLRTLLVFAAAVINSPGLFAGYFIVPPTYDEDNAPCYRYETSTNSGGTSWVSKCFPFQDVRDKVYICYRREGYTLTAKCKLMATDEAEKLFRIRRIRDLWFSE